jgi:hypothetical protein
VACREGAPVAAGQTVAVLTDLRDGS